MSKPNARHARLTTPGGMKKAISLLFAVVSTAFAVVSHAAPLSAQALEDRAAAIGNLMQDWQAKILAYNLPVEDAKNWSRRNMAKFSKLNSERLALAQRAGTLAELELVLMEAPVGDGSRLDVLMANKRGDITMLSSGAKNAPGTNAYAGMVFTALSPCRMLDSRVSQGGTGAWMSSSINLIKIGPYAAAGGGYAMGAGAQGGSITGCGLDIFAGPGQVAMIMAAVSTVAQAGPGYLTFFSNGAPNPGLSSVSQWYQPGYVQTSFVVIPSDLVGAVAASGFTSNATEVIIDIVGYFAPEAAEAAVTSITAGTGLTGGTITSTGTVAIATGYQLPQACTNGQVPQSNGAGVWSCVSPPSGSGTVTSVATGAGLGGGPITSTGTITLAATNLLPTVACTANQIPKWSGAAWVCATEATSGGTVTGVTASAPLASSGGTAPNISLSGSIPVASGGTGQTTLASNGVVYGQGTAAVGTAVGTTGQILAGTAGAPAWTGDPSISGNLTLVSPSTATTGNIMKGANPFIHNFGPYNTFIGETAGNFTMTGDSNVGVGFLALNRNTAGVINTASGYAALRNNTTGSANTAYGFTALAGNTTGTNNIAIGFNAGAFGTTGNNNIAIGNQGVFADSNTIRIGDGNQNRAFISGIRGVTTALAAIPVLIDSNGQLGTTSSSRRFKDDISDMDAASSALMRLRPVTFHYKTDRNPSGRTLQYGLIAEEVAEVYPGLVVRSGDGQIETVMYQYLPSMLLNEYQKQQRVSEAQALHIARLEQDRDLQTTRIADLERERRTQAARIDALEKQSAEIAELRLITARLAALLDQQRRSDVVGAGLVLR